jgi:hypothetical protein
MDNLDDIDIGQDNFSDLIIIHMHFHGHDSDPCQSLPKILL